MKRGAQTDGRRPDSRADARNHYCSGIHTNNWPVNMSWRRLCHVYYIRAGSPRESFIWKSKSLLLLVVMAKWNTFINQNLFFSRGVS